MSKENGEKCTYCAEIRFPMFNRTTNYDLYRLIASAVCSWNTIQTRCAGIEMPEWDIFPCFKSLHNEYRSDYWCYVTEFHCYYVPDLFLLELAEIMLSVLRLLFSDTINITDNSVTAQLHKIDDFTVYCFLLAIFHRDWELNTEYKAPYKLIAVH
jgi:hypothetical protein